VHDGRANRATRTPNLCAPVDSISPSSGRGSPRSADTLRAR
jgi:hypothetical protein